MVLKDIVKKLWNGNLAKYIQTKKTHTVLINWFSATYLQTDNMEKVPKIVWYKLLPKLTKTKVSTRPRLQIFLDKEIALDGTIHVGTIGGAVKKTYSSFGPVSEKFAKKLAAAGFETVTKIYGITNHHVIAKNSTLIQNINVPMTQRYNNTDLLYKGFGVQMSEIDEIDMALLEPVNADAKDYLYEEFQSRARGTCLAKINKAVFKIGRTTALTYGQIVAPRVMSQINFPSGKIQMENLIMFSNMSSGGDSGSLILDSDTGKVVALLFAGNSDYTFGIPAKTLEQLYAIQF